MKIPKPRMVWEQGTIRRACLFSISIGIPVIVSVALGEPQAGLLGAVGGLLLSFADHSGSFLLRTRMLAVTAAAMAFGAFAGFLLHGIFPLFWIAFVAATFGVGLSNRAGRDYVLPARQGTMAFAVAAGIPDFDATALAYFAGAFALTLLARSADHLLFGPLPPLRANPAPQQPLGRWGWVRFAVCYSAAAVAALWIGRQIDPTRALWVVVTALVVMQPDSRSSYFRIGERIAGTLIGVAGAWIVTATLPPALAIAALVTVLAAFVPHHATVRYWLHTALIAMVILLVYDLVEVNSRDIHVLFIERISDMLVGCVLAAIGTAFAFPHSIFAGFRSAR
jgi:hypothetical protein